MTSFIATFGPSTINIIPTLQDLNLTKSKRQGNLKMTEFAWELELGLFFGKVQKLY
jgi:hypothetical protein